MIGTGTGLPIITDVMLRAGRVFGKWELRTEGRYIDKIVEKGLYLPTATSGLSISGLIRLLSQEPAHRECVEHSNGKGSVGLRRIVGKRADSAVKRLHQRHGDSQKRDCHAGTNTNRDQDRQQQRDASRSRVLSEAVIPA